MTPICDRCGKAIDGEVTEVDCYHLCTACMETGDVELELGIGVGGYLGWQCVRTHYEEENQAWAKQVNELRELIILLLWSTPGARATVLLPWQASVRERLKTLTIHTSTKRDVFLGRSVL
jgi:hypothetical protein